MWLTQHHPVIHASTAYDLKYSPFEWYTTYYHNKYIFINSFKPTVKSSSSSQWLLDIYVIALGKLWDHLIIACFLWLFTARFLPFSCLPPFSPSPHRAGVVESLPDTPKIIKVDASIVIFPVSLWAILLGRYISWGNLFCWMVSNMFLVVPRGATCPPPGTWYLESDTVLCQAYKTRLDTSKLKLVGGC